MNDRITNEVIVERIEGLKESMCKEFKSINEHLKELNSNTAKNTKFRISARAILALLSFLTEGGIIGIILFVIRGG